MKLTGLPETFTTLLNATSAELTDSAHFTLPSVGDTRVVYSENLPITHRGPTATAARTGDTEELGYTVSITRFANNEVAVGMILSGPTDASTTIVTPSLDLKSPIFQRYKQRSVPSFHAQILVWLHWSVLPDKQKAKVFYIDVSCLLFHENSQKAIETFDRGHITRLTGANDLNRVLIWPRIWYY